MPLLTKFGPVDIQVGTCVGDGYGGAGRHGVIEAEDTHAPVAFALAGSRRRCFGRAIGSGTSWRSGSMGPSQQSMCPARTVVPPDRREQTLPAEMEANERRWCSAWSGVLRSWYLPQCASGLSGRKKLRRPRRMWPAPLRASARTTPPLSIQAKKQSDSHHDVETKLAGDACSRWQ
jgi:hypothetical protein